MNDHDDENDNKDDDDDNDDNNKNIYGKCMMTLTQEVYVFFLENVLHFIRQTARDRE